MAALLSCQRNAFLRAGPPALAARKVRLARLLAATLAKGVSIQGRWNLPGLLHAPFGRFAQWAIAATLGSSRKPGKVRT